MGYFIGYFELEQCSKSSRTVGTLRFLRAVCIQTNGNNNAHYSLFLNAILLVIQ